MSKFTDNLWRDLVREHGATLAQTERPEPRRARRAAVLRRPRVLAGGSLGLAGVATALVLALGGTAATAPAAFAVTRSSDGSLLVKLNYFTKQNLAQLNAKLAAMGAGETVTVYNASGPAPVAGPVTCTVSVAGAPYAIKVKVLEGAHGTEVIGPGQSAGNTAEGTFHVARCVVMRPGGSGNTGNSGAA